MNMLARRGPWVANRERMSLTDAEKKIKKMDKERADFHKRYFAKDPNEPSHYDIILNVETLPLDQAVNVIVGTYKERFGDLKGAAI